MAGGRAHQGTGQRVLLAVKGGAGLVKLVKGDLSVLGERGGWLIYDCYLCGTGAAQVGRWLGAGGADTGARIDACDPVPGRRAGKPGGAGGPATPGCAAAHLELRPGLDCKGDPAPGAARGRDGLSKWAPGVVGAFLT